LTAAEAVDGKRRGSVVVAVVEVVRMAAAVRRREWRRDVEVEVSLSGERWAVMGLYV
jgi:hypothetical protein